MNSLLEKIEETLRTRGLFQRGQRILVAVSGGLDSMVLLDLLHQLSTKHNWKLTVAHFNHQLRGRSSDADEGLVRKTAAKLKLQFVIERGDVKKFAKTNRLSIEMAARELRHKFFARTARRLKIKFIALAHHADDQVELFFLRLLRGAGSEGLAGMNLKSLSPQGVSIELVRPLLDQPRKALCNYAVAKQIFFREDASNAHLDFQRNRIRHELIPLLEKHYQPALRQNVLRTMEIVSWESNFVLGAALDWLCDKKPPSLEQLHIAVQRVCIRLQLGSLGILADFELVEQLRLHPNRTLAVSPNIFVHRDSLGFILVEQKKKASFKRAAVKIDLAKQCEIQFGGAKLSWAFVNKKGSSLLRKPDCEFFDAKKVGPKIILRHWKVGDRFQPIGMRGSTKLQNLFTNLKIPKTERHKRIVATTEGGELFWVEGLRISERFKLDNQTSRRLKWEWHCL